MKNLLSTVPNQLTAARLLLVPVMWLLAALDLPFYVGLGVFICFVTDVLDGYVARRLNQVSEFGSKFDSIADSVLELSAIIWLIRFQPSILRDGLAVCIAAVSIYVGSLLVGLLKFRRLANLHLHSSRYAAVAMYLFMSFTLMSGGYSRLVFYAVAAMFILSSSETLILQLISSRVDEHMGSLLFVLQRRSQRKGVGAPL